MSIHYCMQNPCPVCSSRTVTPYPYQTTSGPVLLDHAPRFTSMITTSWGIPITRRYYTWREAFLVALNSGSTLKPRVVRDEGMWKVTTYQQPVAINA